VDLQQESHYHAYLNISRESATILKRRGSLQHPPGSEPPKEESIAVQTTPFFDDVWLLCNNCPVALKITHGQLKRHYHQKTFIAQVFKSFFNQLLPKDCPNIWQL
jgi:hypothetical protein